MRSKKPFQPPLAIQKLKDGPDAAEGVDAFLSKHTFPLVERNSVTFVYRGTADGVFLHQWIYGVPSRQPYERLPESDFWYLVQEVPANSRIEYKVEVQNGDEHRLMRDPHNSEIARDPFGANSVVRGDGYEVPDWVDVDPETRPGTLKDIFVESEAFGGSRRVTMYLPARFRTTRRYPLLIAHDGGDYLRFSSMKNVLDNLIHRLEIPSLVVALTHPEERLNEYGDDPRHARYLTEELVPYLEKEFPLMGTAASRGLLGASFGGVAALSTAWRYPGFYGRLLLQSGSFAFTDIGEHGKGPAFDSVVEFVNAFRESSSAVTERTFLTCGVYESLIYENRSLLPILQNTGMDVRYVETRDGHNWENWRDTFREGLSWLFPGPLWMVYE